MSAPYRTLDRLAPWTDAQELRCMMVIPEAKGVATFCFKTMDDSWFRYAPGQFITLELPTEQGPVMRTYTLSSSPSRPLSINVTVKETPGSIGTAWMMANVRPGTRLRAFGPAGLFTFHNHPAPKYLFIGAGSGITPIMSMTRWLFDSGEQPDLVVIQAAHRPSELIFRSEMERMAQRVPGIKLSFVVSGDDPYDVWTGYRGRLNQLMLALMAPDFHAREVFCCGPAGFMEAVRAILIASGFDMARYHEESFAAPIRVAEERPVHADPVPAADAGARVTFAQSGRTAECAQTDTILSVAKAQGLSIPSACNFGVCGTCKVQKLSGEVHMIHNGGISADDVAAGYILACCTHPLGAVTVAA